MTSKIISIREDIYNKLKHLKESNESFSELLERLISNQKKDPLKHFGIAKKLSKEVLDDFENAIFDAKKEEFERSSKRFLDLWGVKE